MKLPTLTTAELLSELARLSMTATEDGLVASLATQLNAFYHRCSDSDGRRPWMFVYDNIAHELTIRGYFTAEQFVQALDALNGESLPHDAEVALAA